MSSLNRIDLLVDFLLDKDYYHVYRYELQQPSNTDFSPQLNKFRSVYITEFK